jgi:hypothetical protein
MTDELTSLLKAELVALCEEHGLTSDGTKALLIERLTNHLYPEEEEVVEEVKVSKGNITLPSVDPLDMSVEDFVEKAYMAVLGREVDLGGKKHYVRSLGPLGTLTRQQMLDSLFASKEYKEKHS